MKILLDSGAAKNAIDESEQTPLHLVFHYSINNENNNVLLKDNSEDIKSTVEILLENGVDINLKNKKGKCALDLGRFSLD